MDATYSGQRLARRPWLAVGIALLAAGCGPSTAPSATTAATGGWYELEGSLNASGSRHTISLGSSRGASIVELTGSLLLVGPSRPGVGFHGEAIGLSDSVTGFQGRAVWTDENGDQLFSELRGEGTAKGNHISGTFVGGTGRYRGATGSYGFEWQYVLESEDGLIQGRGVGLTGRVRVETGTASTTAGKGQQ
jgi:hypothetical protein